MNIFGTIRLTDTTIYKLTTLHNTHDDNLLLIHRHLHLHLSNTNQIRVAPLTLNASGLAGLALPGGG